MRVAIETASAVLLGNDTTGPVVPDDLSREVYCVLGMPVDAIRMDAVLRRIEAAAATRVPFLISTANLNFLVNSQLDKDFRDSLDSERSLYGGRYAYHLDRMACRHPH